MKRKLKICWLPAGSEDLASSRLRCFGIHSNLCKRGYHSRIGYHDDADILVVQKKVDHLVMQRVYQAFRAGQKVIFDTDDLEDAYFGHGQYVDALVETADLITTATEEQKKYIQGKYRPAGEGCSLMVSVLPNPVDYGLNAPIERNHQPAEKLNVVWFGADQNLRSIRTGLERILTSDFCDLTLITVPEKETAKMTAQYANCTVVPWTLGGFVEELGRYDVAVLSHHGNEITQAKSANKMVTAVMCGLPVIASRTPDYEKLARKLGVSDYLFRTDAELMEMLDRFYSHHFRNRYLLATQAGMRDSFNIDTITDLFLEHVARALASVYKRTSDDIFGLVRTISAVHKADGLSFEAIESDPPRSFFQRTTRVLRSPAALRNALERRLANINRTIRSRIRRAQFPLRARLYGLGWKQLIPVDEIRLHVGCGDNRFDGYINIDAVSPEADWNVDLDAIRLPDSSVARIEGYHVIEHLSLLQAKSFLKDAHRLLHPGGKIILEYPDIGKIARLLARADFSPDFLTDHPLGLRGIFGEPKPGMTIYDFHRWGYSCASMRQILKDAGFKHVQFSEGLSHGFPLRDSRVEAEKG